MGNWALLTNHAQVLLAIASDPASGCATSLPLWGITERSAHAIVTDLTSVGYVAKYKDGRRDRSGRGRATRGSRFVSLQIPSRCAAAPGRSDAGRCL